MRPRIASPSSQTLIHQRRSNQPGVTGLWEEISAPEELMEPGRPTMHEENPADEEDLSLSPPPKKLETQSDTFNFPAKSEDFSNFAIAPEVVSGSCSRPLRRLYSQRAARGLFIR